MDDGISFISKHAHTQSACLLIHCRHQFYRYCLIVYNLSGLIINNLSTIKCQYKSAIALQIQFVCQLYDAPGRTAGCQHYFFPFFLNPHQCVFRLWCNNFL